MAEVEVEDYTIVAEIAVLDYMTAVAAVAVGYYKIVRFSAPFSAGRWVSIYHYLIEARKVMKPQIWLAKEADRSKSVIWEHVALG